uniref:Uncharacterized protein n=1 Tax=Eutreptiella gymnastica TaxID=73025 RepID=A0A7S4LBW8_9EUGL
MKTVKEMVKKTVKKKVTVTKEVERMVFKPVEITLQALVDHNTYESGEATVEGVLFAAAFDEMLSFLNAKKVLKTLRKKKKETDDQAAALKRKREEEHQERQAQLLKQREEYEATNDELLAALKETSDVLKNSKTTVHDR